MVARFVVATAAVLLVVGCSDRQPSHGGPDGPDPPGRGYRGPPARLEVDRDASAATMTAVFDVPTGGWRLTFDRGEVHDETARMFVTLERPGPEEIVTQAFQRKHVTWSVEKPVSSVRLLVRSAVRGVDAASDHRLAASWPRAASENRPAGGPAPSS